MLRNTAFFAAMLLSLLAVPSTFVHAAYGGLDTAFDTDGSVFFTATQVGLADSEPEVTGLLKQPDGKIIFSANSFVGPDPYPSSIVRVTAAGALDTSFGTGGSFTFDINGLAVVRDIALQGSQILFVGNYGNTTDSYGGFIGRLSSGGVLDTSFGNHYSESGTTHDGYALMIGDQYSFLAVEVDSNNRIIVLGEDNDQGDSFLARYSQAGVLDPSFGINGITTFANTNLTDMAMREDGSFLLGGYVGDDVAVYAVEADGDLDTSFASNGIFTEAVPGVDYARSEHLSIASDGSIMLGGYVSDNFDRHAFYVRIDEDGEDFDVVTVDDSAVNDQIQGMVADGDGALVVGGILSGDQGVLRAYDLDGDPISSFGTSGVVDLAMDFLGEPHLYYEDERITVAVGQNGTPGVRLFQYISTEPEPAPTEVEETSSRRTGTSIQSRVKALIRMGNTARAEELMRQYPRLFPEEEVNKHDSTVPLPVRDLVTGMSGEDVRSLQKLLNANGFVVANTGPGSAGSETDLFGALTRAALAGYQAAHGIAPALGYLGPVTRTHMKIAGMQGIWW
ncbi:MAG TPA: peptidoglycan-binding protein [Candidatus Paceibacterota bacterium]